MYFHFQPRMARRAKRDVGAKGRPSWVEVGGLLVGIATVLIAFLALKGDSGGPAHSGHGRGNLKLVDVRVREGVAPSPHVRVEIVLHNLGGGLVVVDQANLQVRRRYELPRCASQDDLPLSNTYGVPVPVQARPGNLVEAPLHQQIGPDDADRLAFSLSAKWPGDGATSTLYLFEFDLSLLTDQPRPEVSLGRVLVSLPHHPFAGEYFWGSDTEELIQGLAATSPDYVKQLRNVALPCWRSNTRSLRQAFASSAALSPELEAVSAELVPPNPAALP
jgi:hypothetical protein